ncbi:hypothetical protein SDC9_176317 [bioreactor metagenome]|uniref:Uncharacterized protein n=1 Tax=bioreactor metagenome TaxID=1076179 RepID=A0A645GSE9_9ZZZZ
MHQLVRKFGEGHAFTGFTAQTFLYGIFRHHVINRDVLADIANKRKERKILHPVVIVYQNSFVGNIAFKIEEFGQLFFYRFLVMPQGVFVQ